MASLLDPAECRTGNLKEVTDEDMFIIAGGARQIRLQWGGCDTAALDYSEQ